MECGMWMEIHILLCNFVFVQMSAPYYSIVRQKFKSDENFISSCWELVLEYGLVPLSSC